LRSKTRFACSTGLSSSAAAPPRRHSQGVGPAGFLGRDFSDLTFKRGALITGIERGVHPANLKRRGGYLEFGDLFEQPALTGVL
jgi:hypothetical protein